MQSKNGSLPLINTIKTAANQLWAEKRNIGFILLLLVLVNVALDQLFPLGSETENEGWLYLGLTIQAIIYTLFAVRVHRLILGVANPIQGIVRWSSRETRFLAWMVLCTITVLTAWVSLVAGMGGILAVVGPERARASAMVIVMVIASLPAAYLAARLTVLFPSIAIDRHMSIKSAWALTKGNGWRLVTIVWVPAILISTLPISTWFNNTAGSLLFNFILGIVTALEVAFISVAYKVLGGLTLSPDQAKEA